MCSDYAGMRINYLQKRGAIFCEWNEGFRTKTQIEVVDKLASGSGSGSRSVLRCEKPIGSRRVRGDRALTKIR